MKKIVAIDPHSGECIHYCRDDNLSEAIHHITINLKHVIQGHIITVNDNTLDFSKQPHSDCYVQPDWIKDSPLYYGDHPHLYLPSKHH